MGFPSLFNRKLDQVIALLQIDTPSYVMAMLQIGQGSAFENAIRMLRITFERHFRCDGRRYTRHPVTGEVTGGVLIVFVESALQELGITSSGAPYSLSAIANARFKT